jgi:hypothetical protein
MNAPSRKPRGQRMTSAQYIESLTTIDSTVAAAAARWRKKHGNQLPLILALDIATRTGFAYARLGERPISSSVRFGNESDNQDVIFAASIEWLWGLLEPTPRPDIIAIEAMLPPEAKVGSTSKAVRDRLAGLHGTLRGVAKLRGVAEIALCQVGDVRAHFIGMRGAERKVAKPATVERCRQLGWSCRDDNAADALAVWSYTCAIIDPKRALDTVPLFNAALR